MAAALSLSLGWYAPAEAEVADENELKVAFLYNFALFTRWPAVENAPFKLCFYGQRVFGDAVRQLEGKMLHEAPLTIQYPATPAEATNCHMLFFSPQDDRQTAVLLETLRSKPILTVSDHPLAWSSGAMIVLAVEPNRVRFDINTVRAGEAGLQFSSKLLRLARTVR